MLFFAKKRRAEFERLTLDLDKRQNELENRESALRAAESNFKHEKKSLEDEKTQFDADKKAFSKEKELAGKIRSLANEVARRNQESTAEASHLKKRADGITEERKRLEVFKAELFQREQIVIAAEQRRDAGFADERTTLLRELQDKRAEMESEINDIRAQRLSTLEDEIARLKEKRLEDIAKAEQAERDRIRGEIESERGAWKKEQDDVRKRLEMERTEVEKQKSAVSALRSELEGRKAELEANERTLERKEQRLERQWQKRNDELDDHIEERLEEERKSLAAEKQSYQDENIRLRESIRVQTELVGAFEILKRLLKDKDPTEVIRDLNSKTDELKRLREELATRPTEEMRDRYREMDFESQRQKARIEELNKQIDSNAAEIAETADLRRKNSDLDAENKSLAQKVSIWEGAANEAHAELKRLRAAYDSPAEAVNLYKAIEMPHIRADKVKQPTKADIDEMTWLTGVGNACEDYGFHFNPRILKAFHTSLKTAEWSPLAVLAGVSGTGKSKLPELYSHFGGLMFESLSVQPNWDSQESMLGFFNSIDNKFDAQPVLRFLAQSQKKWIDGSDGEDGYPGLQDTVCLILLDEMNLAHPELYFAEFLSKLEERRGKKGADVPCLLVKIGAAMEPYQLPLGRNVLWAGTMNQDETTKSLSDKVLDRSIIIHFPRPTHLERRLKLIPLDEKNRGQLLHKEAWQNWLVRGTSFTKKDIEPFKTFIENMNKALEVAGRAIGHRVWQSIEYYMANYPDVLAAQKENDKNKFAQALHVAFEDQLVQKVMPKLRGIDTRGKSKTECLDRILAQLTNGIDGKEFKLTDDFNLACELGYGQFIWQSANYLKEEEGAQQDQVSTADREVSDEIDKPGDEPPAWFRPEDAMRKKLWGKYPLERRDELIGGHENRPN